MENVNRAQVVDVHELINTLHRQATSNDPDLVPITLSGSIVSFDDPIGDLSLQECVVDIEPVQSGTGDPSPSNIRPISGWSEVNVTRTGKNLLDKANVLQDLFVRPATMTIGSLGATGASVYCPIKGGETYTVSKIASARFTIATTTDLPANNVSINDYRAGNSATSLTIQTTENDKYIVAFVYLASADTGKTQQEILDSVQVEKGSTATTYEPYSGNTYALDWTTPAGTVYGGTLDAVSGVLTVTQGYIESYAGETLPSTWISDRDVYAAGTTPTTGAQVVYELAEPVTVELTPTEVTTLQGTNNIWADSGDITVTYLSYE